MPPYKVRKDIEQLEQVIEWLDGWQERRRDPAEKRRIEQASNVTLIRKPGLNSG
jgi:ribosome modulation factor